MPRKRTTGAIVLGLLKNGILTTTELFINAALTPFRVSYKGGPAPLRGKYFSIRETFTTTEEELQKYKELERDKDRQKYKEDRERQERSQFYNLLISLKRDGLIIPDSSGKKGVWSISKKGRMAFKEFEKQPQQRYLKNDSKEVVVVSYDIPEKNRFQRDWLRGILKFLGFKLLHQSVWIGKIEIPETLLIDIHKRKIATFIHIFTIGKEGSLTQVL
ncbi:hypothetical protein HY061_02355 [Candidatus Azambacteria bacterium]|nr:hypothetical protein [Candidatus Azambacteria bacterium]